MKGLSLWQPWASLVRAGAKRIETRPWETSYRGPLLVCSTASTRAADRAVIPGSRFHRALLLQGLGLYADPRHRFLNGHALAVAWLVDCFSTTPLRLAEGDRVVRAESVDVHVGGLQSMPPRGYGEQCFGNYAPGRFAWLLHDVRPLPEPFPIVGGQKLWNLKAAATAEIARQLGPLTMSRKSWVNR